MRGKLVHVHQTFIYPVAMIKNLNIFVLWILLVPTCFAQVNSLTDRRLNLKVDTFYNGTVSRSFYYRKEISKELILDFPEHPLFDANGSELMVYIDSMLYISDDYILYHYFADSIYNDDILYRCFADSIYTEYYENQQKKREGHFYLGVEDGAWQSWDSLGRLNSIRLYHFGELLYEFSFHTNGALAEKKEYNGYRTKIIEFENNGRLYFTWSPFVRHGKWYYWDNNGHLYKIEKWRRNRLVRTEYID